MSESQRKRLDKLEGNNKSDRQEITDISFIIPGKPVQRFGIEFEDMEQCLAYCDANDIPYTKEKGIFGWDTYSFPNG